MYQYGIAFLSSLFLLGVTVKRLNNSPDCDSFNDCQTCTNHWSWNSDHCRWCPLDKACHAYGSLRNPCRTEQNIIDHGSCYNTSTGKYEPEFAYSNLLLSAAAYSDDPQECIDRIESISELKLVRTFEHSCEDLPLFHYDHCFAYLAISERKKMIVLSYRGTKGREQLIDEIITVLAIPKESFPTGGGVQDYFKQAHSYLYRSIKPEIKDLIKKHSDYKVVITGHSLGGALASLSAALLVYEDIINANATTLYTFGMPRVGDKEYALQHDKLVRNSWRVVHFRDIVSHLPTCSIGGCAITSDGPYHHGTEIFYYNSVMRVNSTYIQCDSDEDDRCSDGHIDDSWCIPLVDLDECIGYHNEYFGVQVGSVC